jgi:hypothetical protein
MISYLLSFFPHLHKQLKQTSSWEWGDEPINTRTKQQDVRERPG